MSNDLDEQDTKTHSPGCKYAPRMKAEQLQPTAYDRDQQALRDRVFKLECQDEVLLKRLNAALHRIEQLERDIALDRAEAIKSEKCIEALLGRVNQLVEFHGIAPIGGARVMVLQQCSGAPDCHHCHSARYDEAMAAMSPAIAYPPPKAEP